MTATVELKARSYVADFGPVLNIVDHPPGCCATCGMGGPASVHPTRWVWLVCGHSVPLPPFHASIGRAH